MPTKPLLRRTGTSRRRSSAHSPRSSKAGGDQKHRPPVAIPAPELDCGDVAGDQKQRDHAHGNQDDGTDERRNPRTIRACTAGLPGVALRLPCFALRAPCRFLLFAMGVPLGLWIIGGGIGGILGGVLIFLLLLLPC